MDGGILIAVKITPASDEDQKSVQWTDFPKNDDRKPLADMVAGLGISCWPSCHYCPIGPSDNGDGYISKELFARLWKNGLHLITGIRKNIKNYLMPMFDKPRLRKSFII